MSFLFINKTLRLNNLKTRAAMNAKISVFVICVEAIIYLLLYNLHNCTFKLFKANISFNISFTKSIKPLFFIYVYILKISSKILMLFTPSEQFRRFSLKLQNLRLSPRDKYQIEKFDIFLGGQIRGDVNREISRCFSSH